VEGGWGVLDCWESRAHFDRFAEERIGPAMAAIGGTGQQPEVHEFPVHEHVPRYPATERQGLIGGVFGGVEDDLLELKAPVCLPDVAVYRDDQLRVVRGGDDLVAAGLEAAPRPGHAYPASTPTTKSMSGSRICSISVSSGVMPISRQRLR
jgi:hypothetical protein